MFPGDIICPSITLPTGYINSKDLNDSIILMKTLRGTEMLDATVENYPPFCMEVNELNFFVFTNSNDPISISG